MKKNNIIILLFCFFIVFLPAQAMAMVQTTGSASASMDSENKPDTTPKGFTPKGNATVVDDVKTENEKEFFTISTPNENIFYLIVDRARESENVYFLNEVTEQDLFSLTSAKTPKETAIPEQKEPVCHCTQKCAVGMVNVQCELCSVNLKKCIGITTDTEETQEAETKKENIPTEKGTMIFSIVGIVIAIVVGYYFKVYRPKQEYIDDDDEEAEEKIVNEDEQENKEEIFVNEDDIAEEKNDVTENKTSNVKYYDDVPDEYINN